MLLAMSLSAAAMAAAPVVSGDGQLRTQRVPLEAVGFAHAVEERPAMGPELYAAGPAGVAALYDPVRREVVLVADGAAPERLSVGRLDDVAFAGDALLLLDESGRLLTLMSASGEVLDVLPLPGLVPPGCRLAVDGAEVRARDVFGNLHRLAEVTGQGLSEGAGPALVENPSPIQWDAEARVMRFDGGELALTDALKAGGQWLDGARGWLVVDAVVGDMPLVVERRALRADGSMSVTVPLAQGAWAPGRDAAVSPDGTLLLLLPGDDAFSIGRISP